MDNTERASTRDKKNKGYEFRWKNSMKFFSAAVRKWEMLATSKVKNARQWKKKKSEQEHKQQNVLWANTIAFPP